MLVGSEDFKKLSLYCVIILWTSAELHKIVDIVSI